MPDISNPAGRGRRPWPPTREARGDANGHISATALSGDAPASFGDRSCGHTPIDLSNGEDVVAIRLALVRLGAGVTGRVWNRDGISKVPRIPGETQSAWLERVLGAWGVSVSTASSEAERYLSWRQH